MLLSHLQQLVNINFFEVAVFLSLTLYVEDDVFINKSFSRWRHSKMERVCDELHISLVDDSLSIDSSDISCSFVDHLCVVECVR